MMADDLGDVFAKAAELADAVPERYRDRAFELAVRHSLGALQTADEVVTGAAQSADLEEAPRDNPSVEPWLARVLDGVPDPDVIAESGSRVHQAMYGVIALVKAGQRANVESVRKYLREKLGITPQSGSHTSDTLKGLVPRYLSRESSQEGRGFDYAPTAKALEVFGDLS